MPRPPSDLTFQVAFKIPETWIAKADTIASHLSSPGMSVTRTDVLRQAVYAGLEQLGAAARSGEAEAAARAAGGKKSKARKG